ncbi:MAG TPA: ADOP family duplicated permease [Vicinamibacterales bacterium]|nr:ADOP family duplicated permease [Vicinamibacterales bacterium]
MADDRSDDRNNQEPSLRILDAVFGDARYALRGMRRTPAFTAVALATLALAIGANTAIFSVVNRLLIRPLPYRDAERVVTIDATRRYEGTPRPGRVSWQIPAAERWQGSLHAFSGVTFYTGQVFQRSSRDGAELIDGATVAPSFFSTLDGPMAAGRPLAAADALAPSIVISTRLAHRLFGSAPAALGAHLDLNSQDYVVIGVAAPQWDMPAARTDVWESAAFARVHNPQCCGVQLLGRLRPGVTIDQARADVAATGRALAAADSKTFGRVTTDVTTLRLKQLGDGRAALLLLWAAVGLILLVACANIVNLLVARNVSRAREIAIRRALGASRSRLIVQGMIESALLAAGGVAGGLVIAQAAAAALARVDPDALPMLGDVRLDPLVLAFACALGAAATLATGILPAIQAAKTPPPRTTTNTPAPRHRRLQQLLCVAQLAAAVVLLVAATLLGRSLVGLLDTDLGVAPDHVVTASINTAFGRPHTAEEVARTMQQVVDRVRQLPGVVSAGAGTSLPPDTSRLMMSLKRKADDVDYVASAVSCTPGYFQALGIRLLKGRWFTEADDAQHPPVLVVSATTARHLFGRDDPIGQTFGIPKFRYKLASGDDATVIGVVSDVKYSGIDQTAGDQVYWSLAQAPWLSNFLTIRTSGDGNVAAELRHAVAAVDPTVAVSSIKPLDGIIASATAPARFRTTLVAAFALIGLAIAAIGLYGIVAYSVSQRTAEIGIRMALGARTGDVMSIVFRESLAIAAAGVAIGLPAAYATSRAFAALLFGVKATDGLTYAAAAVGLMAVAVAASSAPARRAARVDPIVALRAE